MITGKSRNHTGSQEAKERVWAGDRVTIYGICWLQIDMGSEVGLSS